MIKDKRPRTDSSSQSLLLSSAHQQSEYDPIIFLDTTSVLADEKMVHQRTVRLTRRNASLRSSIILDANCWQDDEFAKNDEDRVDRDDCHGDESDDHLQPAASAEALSEASVIHSALPSNAWQQLTAFDVQTAEAVPLGSTRPEFIYVNILKSKHNQGNYAGIAVANSHRGVLVAAIDPDGPLRKSNFRPGDEIVSVNGVGVDGGDAMEVKRMILEAQDSLAILVRNRQGEPNVFSSSIQKPNPDDRVNIYIASLKGTLLISRLPAESLFAGSLLVKDHRPIEINGTNCKMMTPDDAARLITRSKDFVTIVSRPLQDCEASVISCSNPQPVSFWSY